MRRRVFQTAIWLFVTVALVSGAVAEEILVVGLSIQHREVDTVEAVLESGVYYLPLEPLARATGCTLEQFGTQVHVETPLGTVFFYEQDLRWFNGALYVSQVLVEQRLHTPVTFDEAEFALDLDLPWRPAWGEPRPEQAQLIPDAEPSGFGVSTFRNEYKYSSNERSTHHRNSTILDGRAAGGTWQMRYDTNFDEYNEMREYNWQRAFGQAVFQAGRQWVQLHPLLNSLDFTGAQLGWTNQNIDNYESNSGSRNTFFRSNSAVRTFRGRAAPGSFVQLRVDGVVLGQTVVGLSGEFEFLEVLLPSVRLNFVEIYIFDHNNLSVPVEVRELRIAVSKEMLPSGAMAHLGGVGMGGNLSDGILQSSRHGSEGAAAFYQYRQGITDNLTIEGSIQGLDGDVQGQAGLVTSLFNRLVVSFSGAVSNGESGYFFDLEGGTERWRMYGRSMYMPLGFSPATFDSDYFDHDFMTGFRLSPKLELGLRARYYQLNLDEAQFILPFVSWRPLPQLQINLRPDFYGKYRFDGYWSINNASRLSCVIHETATLDYSHRFNARYGLSVTAEAADYDRTRYSAMFSRTGDYLTQPSFHVGPVYSEGEFGFAAGGSMRVLPGVFASAEYQSHPPLAMTQNLGDTYTDTYLVANLRTDFSFAGGRMFPAESGTTLRNRGAVAGRVLVKGLEPGQKVDLEGIVVVIDNLHKVLTDPSGNFYKGNLKDGIHVVDLDLENMPMELVPERNSLIARVMARAVTRLDFTVRQEYGLAGRVTDAMGNNQAGARVELLSTAGSLVSVVTTDQFGLYRIDHVTPGDYLLKINAADPSLNQMSSPVRRVRVRNEFLFDLDLKVPTTQVAADS